ncbi:site-specific integrase [Sediminicoccus rosea]|uniref:Site-specific integrase n=1 Tax=Sediminicoccus rosea TaxID=1225128 RepID=A0ABZ0PNY0_9PROT|nr:site-specific integrase [Sediminicoccus rosea]WPB87436.1 site-specific integrase [Sediminicoccus rosea]
MATFEQRGAAWRAKVRVRGANLARTFDTYDEALAWARAQEAKLLAGARVQDGQAAFLSVADLMRRYAEEVSPGKRGERWEVVRLTMMLRDASFGTALRDYGPEQVADWRDSRLKIVSAATVNRELNLLSAVFTTAIKDWRIGLQANPVRLTSRPKNPPARKRRVSDDEIAAIRGALGWDGTTKPDTSSQWVAWMHAFAVETAMRRGEIMGMTWRRAHLKAAYVELLDGEEKGRAGQTKTGRGRLVPLSQRALALLKMVGEGDADAPIVPIPAGTADALFRRAVKAAKLDDLHFHDSRREATTRIAPKVGNPMDLAKITGHRDHRQLMDYYAPDATELAKKLG